MQGASQSLLRACEPEALQAFYLAVFGATIVDLGPRPGSERDDRSTALAPRQDPLTISAGEIEHKQDAVVAAGGHVLEPIAPTRGGRRFVFRDPEGNVVQALEPDGSE